MGEANEGRRKGTESFSLQTENYPRDLLHRFIFSSARKSEFVEVKQEEEEEEGSEDVELNLGLSLGGRFGVDKNSKKLIRSSSIAGTITIVRRDEAFNPPAMGFPALIRTSSLPTETEEEWRKRKELQSLRRMEAKRRRSEKQRGKEGVVAVAGRYSEEERAEIEGLEAVNYGEKKGISLAVEENMVGLTVESQNKVAAAAAKQALFGGIDIGKKGRSSFMLGRGHGNGEGAGRPISQGSTESQGGSLSEMSELENKPPAGSNSYGDARSSSSTLTLQEQGNGEAGGSNQNQNASKLMKNTSCKQDYVNSRGRGRDLGPNSMEDMPCVFTVGDGPNGRRVEGILYKYGKGEEVRIMCVCHGTFLSPAEFVKHAGGGDVANPLRHIVVHPKSSSFL